MSSSSLSVARAAEGWFEREEEHWQHETAVAAMKRTRKSIAAAQTAVRGGTGDGGRPQLMLGTSGRAWHPARHWAFGRKYLVNLPARGGNHRSSGAFFFTP